VDLAAGGDLLEVGALVGGQVDQRVAPQVQSVQGLHDLTWGRVQVSGLELVRARSTAANWPTGCTYFHTFHTSTRPKQRALSWPIHELCF